MVQFNDEIFLKDPARVWVEWLKDPAIRNIPLEAHPWAKDNSRTLPKADLREQDKPIIMKVICDTLLKAINFFVSDCTIVKYLATKERSNHTLMLIDIKGVIHIRNAPYLPSFNSTPASVMEPLVLASTCAFGNQKCSPRTGIFTKNGVIISNFNVLDKAMADGAFQKSVYIGIK